MNKDLESRSREKEQIARELDKRRSDYETKIGDLQVQLRYKELEESYREDMSLQIGSLESVNRSIQEKLSKLEELQKNETLFKDNSLQLSLLDNMVNELQTETCFTNHLNQLVEKLNNRRHEQVTKPKELNLTTRIGCNY